MPETLSPRYSAAAIALHWLSAALIVANLLLGISMVPLPLSPRKFHWYAWHKWIGVSVFLLAWARLLWRWARPAPPFTGMAAWQMRAARWTHALLYLLMIAVPLSGWIYSSSTGVQVVYLGLVPLPDLVAKDRVLAATLKVVHVALNVALVTLIAAHVAAALKHHFIDRDNVLARMWPWLKKESIG